VLLGAQRFAFRSVERAKSGVPWILKQWGGVGQQHAMMREVAGMGTRKNWASNSRARMSMGRTRSKDLNHVSRNSRSISRKKQLSWPQLLLELTWEKNSIRGLVLGQWLDAMVAPMEPKRGYAQEERTFKLGSLTCFGGRLVGIAVQGRCRSRTSRDCPDMYVLSQHSSVFCPAENREAAVRRAFAFPTNISFEHPDIWCAD